MARTVVANRPIGSAFVRRCVPTAGTYIPALPQTVARPLVRRPVLARAGLWRGWGHQEGQAGLRGSLQSPHLRRRIPLAASGLDGLLVVKGAARERETPIGQRRLRDADVRHFRRVYPSQERVRLRLRSNNS